MELFLLALLIHVVINLWLIVSAFTYSVLWGILVLLFSPLSAIIYGITNFRDAKLPFLLYLASGVFAVAAFFMISPKDWLAVCERTALCEPADVTGVDSHAGQSPTSPLASTPPGSEPLMPTQQPALPATPTAPTGTQPAPVVTLPATTKETRPAESTASDSAKSGSEHKDNAKEIDPMANFPAKHSLVKDDPLQVKKTPPPKLTEKIKPSQVGKYKNRYLIVTMTNNVERRGLLKKVTATTLTLERKWREKGSTSYSVARSRIKSIQVLKDVPEEDE